jgi:aryl-alcohol dehydrogenase-like predicted oxidoreductase
LERRDLGMTGIRLPVIGVGARAAFDVFGKEGQQSRRALVDTALDYGANFFETSTGAGDADGILASGLTGRRSRALVAASIDPTDVRHAHARIDRLLRLFEERIDLLLVEGPAAWHEFLPAFRHMKSSGEIQAAGISCPDPRDFDELARLMRTESIDVVLVPYSPLTPEARDVILPLAEEYGIGVLVGQPFEGGLLLDLDRPGPMMTSLRKYNVRDLSQGILKWILTDRRVTSVIAGTRRQRHLVTNLRAGEPPWLKPFDREQVSDYFTLNMFEQRD